MIRISKRITILIVLTLLLGVFSGCSSSETTTPKTSNVDSTSNNSTDSDLTVLRFKDTITINELKKLDGKKVQITGFIGGASPLDGSFIYLMNIPYQSCAFCVPSNNNLGNTVAAYPPQGKTIDYKDTPVTITGTLTFGAITDKVGYSYDYSLQNIEVVDANVEGLEKQVQIYTALVDKGFVIKYNEVAGLLFERTSNAKQGNEVDFSELLPLDSSYVSNLRGLLDGLNPDDYTDVIILIDKIEEAVNIVNQGIENENTDDLIRGYDISQEVYQLFYQWLIKPEI